MFDSKARRSWAAIPAVVALFALAACAAPSGGDKKDAANDAAAARFVTCLTGEGQTAKILEGGQVGLLMPDAPAGSTPGNADGGMATLSEGEGQEFGMTMISSDEDGTWMASTKADGYPEEGGQREAWATCEDKVPEFTQPEPEMSGSEAGEMVTIDPEEMIEAGLAFASCARKNGFADFADPDADGMLTLPVGITEDEARSLLEACKDVLGEMPPMVSQESFEALDFDWFAVVSEFFEGMVMSATTIPAEGGE